MPRFFHDSTSDSTRDSHFTTPLTTHIRDSHFATHIRDPHFATTLTTHICDSRLRLTFVTVVATSPSCDSTTDRWTVSTPQRHLPSVPTLTLTKKFGTFSLAWPPPLATAHHHVHHP